MSKYLCARFYQKKKERILKSLVKGIKIFLKKKKTESENMVRRNIIVCRKSIGKNYESAKKINLL